RIKRLWPALMICPVLTWALVRGAFYPSPGFQQVVMSLLILPLGLGRGTGADWSYWTMTIEVRFYVFIALLLLVLNVRKRPLWVLGALLALEGADLIIPGDFALHEAGLSWYGPFFILGALTYLVWAKAGRTRLVAALLLPLTLFMAGLEVYNEWV